MNRLAILDCDGTLVDSGAPIHAALPEIPAENLVAEAFQKATGLLNRNTDYFAALAAVAFDPINSSARAAAP